MKIRPTIVNEIAKPIVTHELFTLDDFEFTYPTLSDDTRFLGLLATYTPNINFTFWLRIRIKEPTNNQFRYYYSTTPGEIVSEEDYRTDDLRSVVSGLESWITRIHEEIVSSPLGRLASQTDDTLQSFLDELEDKNALFSQEEKDHVASKLAELEVKLAAEAEGRIDDRAELARTIKALKKDIELLRASLETQTKGGWGQNLVNRVKKWTSDESNIKLLKSGTDIIRGVLGDGS